MFVAKIHNNSLGKCIQVDTWNEGVMLIIELLKDSHNIVLNDDELDNLKQCGEYYNDNDADNIFTFTIGDTE